MLYFKECYDQKRVLLNIRLALNERFNGLFLPNKLIIKPLHNA